jgi:hypothetical protein
MHGGSPMSNFFNGLQADGWISNQLATTFDSVAFMMLDIEAIVAVFTSKSRRPIHLRRVII